MIFVVNLITATFIVVLLHSIECYILFNANIKTAGIRSFEIRAQSPVADEIQGWDESYYTTFLENYWQKKPVLIRSAFDIRNLTLSPNDIIELSIEEDVESRIIVRDGDIWNKEYGPFDIYYLKKLPDSNWTILVQELDRHIPKVADIWDESFSFIPNWRRDDIMVSYATKDGGIGAHVDNYDVFLLQGRGRRQWSIENSFVSAEEELRREVPNADTRLLNEFVAHQSWELETGDMLYLPPRVPHRGISLDNECMTISMGFRAPTKRSLVIAYCDHVCQTSIPEKEMYADPGLRPQSSPGFVSEEARNGLANEIKSKLNKILDDSRAFDSWLGSYLTIPIRMQARPPTPFFLKQEQSSASDILDSSEIDYEEKPLAIYSKHRVASMKLYDTINDVIDDIRKGYVNLRRSEWIKTAHDNRFIFIDGQSYALSVTAASLGLGSLLCSSRIIHNQDINNYINSCQENEQISFIELLSKFLSLSYYYPIDADR